ncbi:hypothetical protein ABT390_22125 [Streptomyces aurantiacus]|uniref:hypothetical protein n=1 Tax=Streptomyces aurantiacus TaxID=47760 RepID=UPI00055C5E57|nr:hypothetical protein [Streptomyces aurantiacus]
MHGDDAARPAGAAELGGDLVAALAFGVETADGLEVAIGDRASFTHDGHLLGERGTEVNSP